MNDLTGKVKKTFLQKFSKQPLVIKSPGRVNLIGEHTDYNDGFVLPAAIEKIIVLAMAPNGTEKVNLYSLDMDEEMQLDLALKLESSELHWVNYIKGVICEL